MNGEDVLEIEDTWPLGPRFSRDGCTEDTKLVVSGPKSIDDHNFFECSLFA